MNNKLYMITVNNKKFDEWAKKQKVKLKRLKNEAALEHFNIGYNDCVNANYLVRASFVCYWEIYSNNDLARLTPAITQASFIHMLHRFIERGDMEEVNVVQQMMANFVRLLSVLDTPNKNKEVNENDMGENDEDA
tara:strand:+ start:93 stop:497 length:405 start_codon:yes stop_codon:yes gene_type:complete